MEPKLSKIQLPSNSIQMAWLLQYHWAHQSLILGMENSSYIQRTRLILYPHFPPTAFANVTKFTGPTSNQMTETISTEITTILITTRNTIISFPNYVLIKRTRFFGSNTYYAPLIIPKCVFQKTWMMIQKVSSSEFS